MNARLIQSMHEIPEWEKIAGKHKLQLIDGWCGYVQWFFIIFL